MSVPFNFKKYSFLRKLYRSTHFRNIHKCISSRYLSLLRWHLISVSCTNVRGPKAYQTVDRIRGVLPSQGTGWCLTNDLSDYE